jgi:hypothetical protein
MNVNPATASLYAVNPLPRRDCDLVRHAPAVAERVRTTRAGGDRSLALAA